jgi:hypothetical protein
MEGFNLKKLNDVEVKEQRLKSQIGLQLWKSLMKMMWTSVGLGNILEYESFSHRESRLL